VPILALLAFSSFIFFPKQLGGFYVILLAFLCTITEQYHNAVTTLAAADAFKRLKHLA